jgi:hypothetical protein
VLGNPDLGDNIDSAAHIVTVTFRSLLKILNAIDKVPKNHPSRVFYNTK